MKKRVIAIISVCVLLIVCVCTLAACGGNGKKPDTKPIISDTLKKELEIFEYDYTDGKITITGLKDTTFTDITIPNGVTSIESYAFIGCSSLTSVKLKNGQSRKTLKAADQCNEKRLNGQFSLLFLGFSRSDTA